MTRARTEADAEDYPEKVLISGEVDLSIVETAQSATLSTSFKDKLKAIGIVVRPGVVNDDRDNQ